MTAWLCWQADRMSRIQRAWGTPWAPIVALIAAGAFDGIVGGLIVRAVWGYLA